jgi:TatD DNase family protein
LELFDTHCHLQEGYRGERALSEILLRAKAAGVGALVCVGTDPESSKEARVVVGEAGAAGIRAFFSVGLHPHEAGRGLEDLFGAVEELAADARFVAVGECGLDFYKSTASRDEQVRVFEAQLGLARDLRKTAIVHVRAAFEEAASALERTRPDKCVIHCFTGDESEMRDFLDLGCFISFSGIVTFRNAGDVREAARLCPEDRILVETDSPFLAPEPVRGSVNEPANVAHTARFLAGLRGEDLEEFALLTYRNALEAFGVEDGRP